jgi:hypothetical protein
MGKASSTKKVARAARTGGKRSAATGAKGSMMFPGLIGLVVVVGIALIVVSRGTTDTSASPALGEHVHDAYGIYLCDAFQPPLNDVLADPLGIHTHGDGLVHIHPTSSLATGSKATFKHFADDTGVKLTSTSIEMPDGTTKENGDMCGDKPGTLKTAVWDSLADEAPTVTIGNPADTRLKGEQLITIAFVADGTEIPKPESASALLAPSDLPGNQPQQPPQSVVVTVPDETATSTPPDSGAATVPSDGTPTSTP